MSIEKEYVCGDDFDYGFCCYVYTPVCDYCGSQLTDSYGEPFTDYDEAIQGIKNAGWKTVKNKYGEWENYCPSCQKELRRQSAINDFKDL